MKRLFALLLSMILMICCVACGQHDAETSDEPDIPESYDKPDNPAAETDTYIVKNENTDYTIVVPEYKTLYIDNAVDELNKFMYEATGITFPLISESKAHYSADAKYISIGRTTLLEEAEVAVNADLGESGAQISTKGKSLFFVGQEDAGALYAVYDYLYLELNWDYFYKDCYSLDKNVSEIKLRDYNYIDIPDIQDRATGYGWELSDSTMGNRMRLTPYLKSRFTVGSAGVGHTSLAFVADEVQGHEAYWLSDDKTQLCYTAHGNKTEYNAMQQACLNKIKKILQDDATSTIINLGIEDGATFCGCESCQKIISEYGSNSAVIILFMNDLRAKYDEWAKTEEAKEIINGRDIILSFFSYLSAGDVPATYDASTNTYIANKGIHCADGVAVWFASIKADYTKSIYDKDNESAYNTLMGWTAVCDDIYLWTYSTGFKNYMIWYDSFNGMQDNYKLAAKAQVKEIYDQAQHTSMEGSYAWGNLKSYLNSKLAWNSDADLNYLTKKWFRYYFGPIANQMYNYFMKQRVYFNWLIQNTTYSGIQSVSRDFEKSEYWPKPVLLQWLSEINEIAESLAPLKKTNIDLYNTYYYRLANERLSIYYLLVSLYSSTTSADLINEYKMQFKSDVKYLGLETTGENNNTVSVILKNWGIA